MRSRELVEKAWGHQIKTLELIEASTIRQCETIAQIERAKQAIARARALLAANDLLNTDVLVFLTTASHHPALRRK